MRLSVFAILLFLQFNIFGQNPNWAAPNPALYTFSANAIVSIEVDGATSNSVLDTLAFFINNEIRGLGSPVDLGNGQVLHFVTFYSNNAVELMDIEVYYNNSNQVVGAINQIEFSAQGMVGSIQQPFVAECYLNTSPPISLLPFPFLMTIQGVPLDTLNLADYVVESDTNAVIWTYTPNSFLNVDIQDSFLIVEGEAGFIGTTVLGVTASQNGNSVSGGILINVGQSYSAPEFTLNIMQGIQKGSSFDVMDLNLYENVYDGPCLTFDYEPIIAPSSNPVNAPNWMYNANGSTTMSMVIKADFTPNYSFEAGGDELAVFINGQIRGLGSPVLHLGKVLYFVTLGGDVIETDPIVVKFFSSEMSMILEDTTVYSYVPNAVIGNVDAPAVIELSPLSPIISGAGQMTMMINDSNWTGSQSFMIGGFDCNYPDYVSGATIGSFCIVEDTSQLTTYYIDSDGDGYGANTLSIDACTGSYLGWADNPNDCDDSDSMTVSIPYVLNVVESSIIPNDAHVCSGTVVDLTLIGDFTVEWGNGSTNNSVSIAVDSDSTITFALENPQGCVFDSSVVIITEKNVITNPNNEGPATLRSVIECAQSGTTILFDQPVLDSCTITQSLVIDKDITIVGLSPSTRPTIIMDYQNQLMNGLMVEQSSVFSIMNVDFRIRYNVDIKPFISEIGGLEILGKTVIFE